MCRVLPVALSWVLCAAAGIGSAADGQSPPPQPQAVQAAVQAAPPPEGYSYKPDGRRDPFVSLVNRGGADARQGRKKPDGLRGFMFSEVVLRGVVQGGTAGALALVQGPDMRTYLVRVGDQLFDGEVRAITADSLVVLQEVNDPLSVTKRREVRKTLRVVEEVK